MCVCVWPVSLMGVAPVPRGSGGVCVCVCVCVRVVCVCVCLCVLNWFLFSGVCLVKGLVGHPVTHYLCSITRYAFTCFPNVLSDTPHLYIHVHVHVYTRLLLLQI